MNLKLKGRIIQEFGVQWLFAKALGLDEPRVSEVIHGRRELSKSEKKRWAKVLGTKVKELFPN